MYSENWGYGGRKSWILIVAKWMLILSSTDLPLACLECRDREQREHRTISTSQDQFLIFHSACSYFMCSWSRFLNLDITHAVALKYVIIFFNCGPHFPVQSLYTRYTRYMQYKWPSWTNLFANWFHPSEGVYQQHCTLISGFHFLILFCKYIRYLKLEYTKCKYSSCICTNSDPFAV